LSKQEEKILTKTILKIFKVSKTPNPNSIAVEFEGRKFESGRKCMLGVAMGPNPMLTLNLKTPNKNQSRSNNTC
jgi:hypothetical protein